MNSKFFKEVIGVIRNEKDRRYSLLKDKDWDFEWEQWLFEDMPFVNEICLMLLVTLRHHVERELVGLAVLANNVYDEIDGQQYKKEKDKLKKKGNNWDWEKIKKRLNLESFSEYKFIEPLRQISNTHKHGLWVGPGKKLLEILGLNTNESYLSFPESDKFREGLAVFIGLSKKDADYCDITERFVDIAINYLESIKKKTKLSRKNFGIYSGEVGY